METQKRLNLLNDSSNEKSKIVTKNRMLWTIKQQKTNKTKNILLKTESIKSSLLNFFDAYILVTAGITVNTENDKNIAFKNCPLFSTCDAEIDDVFIDDADHIYIAISLYHLIEQSDNCSDTSGSLWHFKRD